MLCGLLLWQIKSVSVAVAVSVSCICILNLSLVSCDYGHLLPQLSASEFPCMPHVKFIFIILVLSIDYFLNQIGLKLSDLVTFAYVCEH